MWHIVDNNTFIVEEKFAIKREMFVKFTGKNCPKSKKNVPNLFHLVERAGGRTYPIVPLRVRKWVPIR